VLTSRATTMRGPNKPATPTMTASGTSCAAPAFGDSSEAATGQRLLVNGAATDGCHLICGAERCCYLGGRTRATLDTSGTIDGEQLSR